MTTVIYYPLPKSILVTSNPADLSCLVHRANLLDFRHSRNDRSRSASSTMAVMDGLGWVWTITPTATAIEGGDADRAVDSPADAQEMSSISRQTDDSHFVG